MRVWVTRTEPGAARTARRLTQAGHAPLVAPVLASRPLPVSPGGLDGAGALAFTSATAVRAFATLTAGRGLPVFTVGDATAAAARAAGWEDVRSADGDGSALARLVADARDAFEGEVLTPGASDLAFDLQGALRAQGVPARALAVYATTPLAEPPALAVTALAAGALDAVVVHSPAGARALAGYAAADPALAARLAPLAAYALSAAVAAALPPRLAAAWPDSPRDADLVALLSGASAG